MVKGARLADHIHTKVTQASISFVIFPTDLISRKQESRKQLEEPHFISGYLFHQQIYNVQQTMHILFPR
jgi:hypothetical protein